MSLVYGPGQEDASVCRMLEETQLASFHVTRTGLGKKLSSFHQNHHVVLYVLNETQKERSGRNVPTAMLWGRVCEYFYISPGELSAMLARLGAATK